jgi:hypothetical protein
MPQLVKRGKYVFGISSIREDYQIQIPMEAFNEYVLDETDILVILSGSKTSGGFGVYVPQKIMDSNMHKILDYLQYDKHSGYFKVPAYTIKNMNQRVISWIPINRDGIFSLNDQLAQQLNIRIGDKLVVARGSNMGPAFVSRGPIYKEAMKYPELSTF